MILVLKFWLCFLFQDESEDYVAHMWRRVALCSREHQEQLTSYQNAIEALNVSKCNTLCMKNLLNSLYGLSHIVVVCCAIIHRLSVISTKASIHIRHHANKNTGGMRRHTQYCTYHILQQTHPHTFNCVPRW